MNFQEPFEFGDPMSTMATYRRVNIVTANETMTGNSIASNMIGESGENPVGTLRSTTRQVSSCCSFLVVVNGQSIFIECSPIKAK